MDRINTQAGQTHAEIDVEWEWSQGFAAQYAALMAHQLAGKAGLSKDDREDIQQNLLLRLWKRFPSFRPARATWEAFVTTVMRGHAKSILDSQMADKHRFTRSQRELDSEFINEMGEVTSLAEQVDNSRRVAARCYFPTSPEEACDVAIDVASVLKRLPSEVRHLAQQILDKGLSRIMADGRYARGARKAKISFLRKAFARAGLRPDFFATNRRRRSSR
jgi:RNA polymerase sigma-70 factor, ECF subfamily